MSDSATRAQSTNWPLVFVLWGLGLAAAMQFAKFSIAQDALVLEYSTRAETAALLLSSVGVMGVLLGAVAGELVGGIGTRFSLLLASGIGVFVSACQAFLPAFEIMFGLRILEGVAHLLIVVSAPTAIISASAPKHQAITMGLWATFFGVAYAISGLAGTQILTSFGLGALMGSHALFLVSLLILYLLLDRQGRTHQTSVTLKLVAKSLRTQFAAYGARATSSAALAFFWHTLLFVALLTFLPDLAGSPDEKSLMVATLPLISIAGSFAGGSAAQHLKRPYFLIGASFAALAILAVFLYLSFGTVSASAVAFPMMFVAGITQAACFAAIPQLCSSGREQAQANGVVTQLGNLGASMGTPIFAAAISAYSLLAIPALVVLVTLAGLLTVIALSSNRPLVVKH